MRPFKSLISFEEAQKIALDAINPISRTEKVKVQDSINRVLATGIQAQMAVPPFDRAAMDGYAVLASDTFGSGRFDPKVLKLVGSVHAGEVLNVEVNQGQCVEIATGAKIPKGADSVVMIEDTERENHEVKVFKPVYPQANMSLSGSDISEGEMVLNENEVLGPGKIGVLTSLGLEYVKVYEKPKVAIIPTGNEVAEVGDDLKDGQVFNSNSYALSAIAKENGAIPMRMGIVEDTQDSLKSAIKKALSNDFVVLSGGSSVGERDVLVDVVEELGEILFHGVQVKPGKPLLLGQVEKKLVLGTPGYPTACLIDGYVFMAPMIRKLAHLPAIQRQKVKAKISRRVVSTLGRQQFLTVRLENGEAIPVFKESGAITSMAEAVGFVEIPANVDLVEKGDSVEVVLF
ncbi:MAG: molybdenum cofactor biosynthesis protein [Thermoplasmata archaeon]|nr:MAG: molybdenum cofactor biosynthesis protein [Thermoplasmata archaeon]